MFGGRNRACTLRAYYFPIELDFWGSLQCEIQKMAVVCKSN